MLFLFTFTQHKSNIEKSFQTCRIRSVATILKMYFREFPLLPANLVSNLPEESATQIRNSLIPTKFFLLKFMLSFLNFHLQYESQSRINALNMATLMSGLWEHNPAEDMITNYEKYLNTLNWQTRTLEWMITNYAVLFNLPVCDIASQ